MKTTATLTEKLRQYERRLVRAALIKTDCNISATAEIIGTDRANVYRILRRLGWVTTTPISRAKLRRRLAAEGAGS